MTDAEAEELAPWLGRVVADLHGGSFEILTEEGIAYRILLPVPAHVNVVAATAPPSGAEGREDAVDPVPERAVPMESPDGPDSSEVAA